MIKIHLSRILGEKRWSQAKLSRLTGIRPSTISEIYNEFSERVNLEHLDKICEVLECDISDILEYIPNTKSDSSKNAKGNSGKKPEKQRNTGEGEHGHSV